jgi:hypothetical protein
MIKRKVCKRCKAPIYGPAERGLCLQCQNEMIEEAREGAEREHALLIDRSKIPRVLQPGEVLPEARMHVVNGMRGTDRLGEAPCETLSLDFRDRDRFEFEGRSAWRGKRVFTRSW